MRLPEGSRLVPGRLDPPRDRRPEGERSRAGAEGFPPAPGDLPTWLDEDALPSAAPASDAERDGSSDGRAASLADAAGEEAAARSASPFQLTVFTSQGPVVRRTFSSRITRIGRHAECELRLDAPTISRRHAEIERVWRSGWVVRDRESQNGVRVNGKPVEVWHLSPGDTIGIGEFALVFTPQEEEPPSTAAERLGGRAAEPAPATPRPGPPPPQAGPPPQVPRPPEPPPPRAPGPPPAAPQGVAAALEGIGAEAEASSAPDPAAETLLGETIDLPPSRREHDQRERSLPVRAYLRGLDEPRKGGVRVCRTVVERDAFVLGGGEDADVRIPGWWVPRVCAVIVRGPECFSVHPVAAWPLGPRVNGQAVRESRRLEAGDELAVAGHRFAFEM